jgi:hypothetical protein
VQLLTGRALEQLAADSAYAGGADLAAAQAAHVTVYSPWQAQDPEAAAQPARQLPKSQFLWSAAEQTYRCPQGHCLEPEGVSRQQRATSAAVALQRFRRPPEYCTACPLRQRCTSNPAKGRTVSRSEHEERIEALRARMQTEEAKALYGLRRQSVELVNADWKQHRKLRRFSGRASPQENDCG